MMTLVGTAGWSIPSGYADAFPGPGTHLARYAERFGAVEINSSFHRPHGRSTYARWAGMVPTGFRFAVKVPKAITHAQRLRDCGGPLDRFIGEVGGLGQQLGALLVQLPPSLGFDFEVAGSFFAAMRDRTDTPLACEPRHPSWFTVEAGSFLTACEIVRVAADPPAVPVFGAPGGWSGFAYLRLHGAPKVYYSDYSADRLVAIRAELDRFERSGTPAWCIFDNTAASHALGNALALVGAERGD